MCFKAQQRVTKGEEPFYELANSEIYTDATFPPTSTEQLYYAEDSAFYRTEDSTAARWLRIHNETNNGMIWARSLRLNCTKLDSEQIMVSSEKVF